jgi:hypothetical protein
MNATTSEVGEILAYLGGDTFPGSLCSFPMLQRMLMHVPRMRGSG